ncbi:MAG TPA: NAD(+) diphosphatase [Aestuariivirgaceae bacterium]|nr:NAD(+) diphosphatase [Aestuariivirgaceae bacterium]
MDDRSRTAQLAFTGSTLDRRAASRDGEGPKLHVLFAGDRVAVTHLDQHMMAVAYAADDGEGETVHLGRRADGTHVVAREIAEAQVPGTASLVDLRTLAMEGRLDAAELAMLAQARALLVWHQRHGFCANCGARTIAAERGYRRDCGQCAAQHFPRTDPVAIVAVTGRKGMLLGRGAHFLPGVYSALAGFLEPGETIEEGARREVREESGIEVGDVAYCASQPWPFPTSLMIGLIGTALSDEIIIDRSELEDVRWFRRAEVEAMLAGTHAGGLLVPKPAAIAHHLITTAASRLSD